VTRNQSLVAALSADAGVMALIVGGIPYPQVAIPPKSGQVLIYKIDVEFTYQLSGPGTVNAAVEIRSWSTANEGAHALADAVHAVLMPAGQATGFKGQLGGAGGIKVVSCLIDKEIEGVVAITADQFVFEVVSTYGLKYVL